MNYKLPYLHDRTNVKECLQEILKHEFRGSVWCNDKVHIEEFVESVLPALGDMIERKCSDAHRHGMLNVALYRKRKKPFPFSMFGFLREDHSPYW